MDYNKIKKEIKEFVDERDWEQFHTPKNLSMALSVEASELLEIFQWQKEEEYNPLDQQIGRLKYKVYGAATDAEEKGLINEDKVQKIRDACEINKDPTNINNKILKNIASDCSIHDARKKKSLENVD